MCIGVPMRVVWSDAHVAFCRLNSKTERVDISLVGEQPEGTWLLVFLGAARSVLDRETALKTLAALQALTAVAAGENKIDHLFPDLHNREPWLPDHLQSAAGPLPQSSGGSFDQLAEVKEQPKNNMLTRGHINDGVAPDQGQNSADYLPRRVRLARGPLS